MRYFNFLDVLFAFSRRFPPRWKITEIPGGSGYDKHPMEWKPQGGGGTKAKVPSVRGYGYFLELHIGQ